MTDHTDSNDHVCDECCQINRRFSLELRYTNKEHDLAFTKKVSSPPTITIYGIIQDLLRFLYLDDVPPEEVRLVGFDRNGRYRTLENVNTQMTVQEIGIINGCTLYFEPSPNAAPPKSCHLTIVGPDEVTKVDYEWYRAKTTLGMLLEFVIDHFSLESVPLERIHLLTIVDELDFTYHSDARLSEFDLHSGMFVHVQIIPPLSSKSIHENTDVHVEYIYNKEKFSFDIPNTRQIGELKTQIEKRIENYDVTDFKLYNENKDEIDLSNPNRTLNSCGIKPGQTISTTFRLIAHQPIANNQAVAASDSEKKSGKVIVIIDYPCDDPESMLVSVNDTVDQLMKRIESKTHNQRFAVCDISSSTISIDLNKDTDRCLADLEFKADDIINVTMTDNTPSNAATATNQASSSSTPDTQMTTHRINENPVGLDNLGNSDYMNSIFQCLAHIPHLTNFFLERFNSSEMDDVGEVTGAYADLLWKLWRCEESDNADDSVIPKRIRKIIGKKDARFATTDRRDAQEFMTFFLDIIHEELKSKNRDDNNTIIKQLFFGEMTSIITCTACNKGEITTQPFNFLSIPLNQQERTFWINFIPKEGDSRSLCVIVPTDGRVEHVVAEFTRFYRQPSLYPYILAMVPDGEIEFKAPLSDIPTDELIFMEQEERTNNSRPAQSETLTRKLRLEDCLSEYFSSELLEYERTCPNETCKKKTRANKQLQFRTLPPVLIIHLKRFSHENGSYQKHGTFVDYPLDGLNLKKYVPSSPSSSSEEGIYDLFAVSSHEGPLYDGRYTAYARRYMQNKSEWYKLDDSFVTPADPENYDYEIVTRSAYLLFYMRRDMKEYPIEAAAV